MTDHLSFERLCDVADGVLARDVELAARDHIRQCDECSARFASLTSLTASAAALPHDIAPPADLWDDIKRDIDVSKEQRGSRRPARFSGWQLAAAAALIAVLSSAVTLATVRGGRNARPAETTELAALPAEATDLPARLASTERGFERSVSALQATLQERRDSLAPTTIATVERSLRVADSAIAEARSALARDPGNSALVKLFASNYERKIDLLKRATELEPRT